MAEDLKYRSRRGSRERDTTERSRSPYRVADSGRRRAHDKHGDRNKHREKTPTMPSRSLPHNARELTKHDYKAYKTMFTLYLDIQKQIDLDSLDQSEAKGRWKSFVNKWNRGELAEGWYDPATLQKAIDTAKATPSQYRVRDRSSPQYDSPSRYEQFAQPKIRDDESSEDDYGPAPAPHRHGRSGPAIPTTQDLEFRRELAQDEALDARDELRKERRNHRSTEKERVEELVPRAEAGTRERQLEKRKELATSNRAFAAAKEGGEMAEVNEKDLMGGDDSMADLKKQKKDVERKKNERELRREELVMARRAEMEEKARDFREREERTMKGLKELAKQRFG